jgi:hypothetical protein
MTPSLGTIIGLPVLLILIIAAAVTGALFWRARRGDSDDLFWAGFAIAAWGTAACLIIGTAIGMWPYKGEYHAWSTTSGTVKAVDSRLVSAGDKGGMNQRFVVTFTDGRQRACDDTRCTTVKPGDMLTLKCKRAYQWGATPGWDCNWLDNRKP